jgi:hypothetical protein
MGKTTEKGLSRRKMMLVTGGAVAGASALLAAPFRDNLKSAARKAVVNSGGSGLLSLGTASYDEWLSVVGTSFGLGGRVNVQLVGVRALPTSGAKPQGVRTQGFAAFFDPSGHDTVAPDLIYTATHSTYGPTQIFLASASDRDSPRRMVAVFN